MAGATFARRAPRLATILPIKERRDMRHLIVSAAVLLAACGSDGARDSQRDSGAAASRGGSVDLTGAGATFPYPLYSKWFSTYATETGVRINYQSIGSGGGIRQLSEGTVDFGASDSPMTDAELAKARGGPVLHIPTVIGAVAVTYNLPELPQPIRLSAAVLGDMFSGRITKWNDPRIAALNAGAQLPASDVLVVHRSDGSGTTYIFTDYLTAASPTWASGPGRGKEVEWPVGLGAKGNEGVAGQVKQTPGAVGYVELAYANQNRLPVAAIQNASGNFVTPTGESVMAAAAGAVDRLGPDTDYRVSIVNAPGAQAYPISSFTWLLVYQNQPDSTKGRKLVEFVRWALAKGDSSAAALDYTPLPETIVQQLDTRLGTIRLGASR
jgi:phosphate transport system substrate-binding protein